MAVSIAKDWVEGFEQPDNWIWIHCDESYISFVIYDLS
jgi:hypothetical protein